MSNANSSATNVFIIVLNWNGKNDTLECLSSLDKLTYQNYQTIVVDNGSSDNSVSAIKQAFPDIPLIETGENLGFAEGNNVGIRYAQKQACDYILLLNNDTTVEPGFLNCLVSEAISKNNRGLFGPKINYFSQPDKIWWAGSRWNHKKLEFEHIGIDQDDSGAFDHPEETDYICGCALLIPSAVMDDIGLMDPTFFLTYEETDWCYRARRAGYPSYYVPGSRIFHKVSVSFGGESSPLQQYFYTRNKLLWASRHLSLLVFIKLLVKTIQSIACWDTTSPFSIQSFRWKLANALRKLSTHNEDPVQAAKAIGLRDFLLRRFGDCTERVRQLGKNTVTPNNPIKPCVGFVPWWPQNPYQVLLRNQLREEGFRIIGNPPLNLLKILLKRDGLDVVHLHWPHDLYFKNYFRYPLAIVTLLLYRLLKNNIVWTVHELEFYETKYPKLDALFVKFLMKVSKALIVHSQYSEDEVRRLFDYKRPIHQVKHPHYIDVYANDISSANAREKLGIEQGVRVFLFLGYIKPYKGVEDLIEAFTAISDSNIRLIIGGTPLNQQIAEQLTALAAFDPRVKLDLFYISDDDMQVYLNAADLVIFPFRQTHTSGSVLLAASFGKPVLVPRTASIPEYIDETMGLFFEPDVKGSLAEALLHASTANLANMGEQALLKVSTYTWCDMATAHAEAYRLAMSKTSDNNA